MNKTAKEENHNFQKILKFIIPSLLGVFLFMVPMPWNGSLTIPIAIFSKLIISLLGDYLAIISVVIISLSAALAIIAKIFKPKFITNNKYLNGLFNVSPLWFSLRIIGAILAIITIYKFRFDFIYSDSTGGTLLYSLLPTLFAVFLFAGLLLPLILDFGLLEFVGTLLSKVMRPIFSLPGRSSIDCITSWLGDGTIGVLLTSKQYEQGFYSKKEAAIIGTNFSVVSITFCLVVIAQVGLEDMFVPFYITVTFIGIVAAVITPRIPPLSKISDTYINGEKKKDNEIIPKNHTTFSYGISKALEKVNNNKGMKEFLIDGIKNVLDMWIGVLPVVIGMGTIALILAEYTHIFEYLGLPFIPLLKLLHIPDAALASKTLIVGFTDMFIPSVIGSTIANPMTRFIVACTSVTQLIYMSEVGGLLLASKIPVNIKDLFIIFLERTLITLPIASLIAHMLF